MKTIDERADMYCREHAYQGGYDLEDVRAAHISGAEAEHEELTRWRNPKEELPEEHIDVEVKTDKGKVSVCNMDLDELGHRFWNVSRTNYMIPDANIIGWREIH